MSEVSVGNDLSLHAETFAQATRGSRHLPRRLRRPRGAPGICRDVCAGRARLLAFAETFAQVARGSRHLPRRLRRPRGVPGICRDVCAGRASSAAFAETFAGLPQTPKSFSRDLRKFRKHSLLRQNVSPVAAGIFFDPRGRRVIRKITAQLSDRSFINKK